MPAGAQSNFAEVGPLTQVDVSEGSAPDLATEAVLVPHAKLETAGHLGPALNLDRCFATAIAARDPEELVLLVAWPIVRAEKALKTCPLGKSQLSADAMRRRRVRSFRRCVGVFQTTPEHACLATVRAAAGLRRSKCASSVASRVC